MPAALNSLYLPVSHLAFLSLVPQCFHRERHLPQCRARHQILVVYKLSGGGIDWFQDGYQKG